MFGLTVTGNPPMKPTSEYTIIGKSYANSVTPSKVSAKETWVTDVRLPDMLHGRVVHPKTLGSTLVSVGDLNKSRYPNAQLIVKGNLVGVVAPTEWEAIGAAQQIAADTTVDRLERVARAHASCTGGCARRPTGRRRRSGQGREEPAATSAPALARCREDA